MNYLGLKDLITILNFLIWIGHLQLIIYIYGVQSDVTIYD
jgi:hypothetical protein